MSNADQVQRKDQIVHAVKQLVDVHDAWVADEQATLVTENFVDAAEYAINVCTHGDLPADCRELARAVEGFGKLWAAYQASGDVRPPAGIWGAFKEMVRALEGATREVSRTIEPVHVLYDQLTADKFSGRDEQIARMYGQRVELPNSKPKWTGPFFDNNERPDSELIFQQAQFEKGVKGYERVLPEGWIHPAEEARTKLHNADFENRLERIDDLKTDEKHEDPATIEAMLREGAYVSQIAKAKHVTEEAVRAVAAEHGIEATEFEGYGAHRSDHEPAPIPEAIAALDAGRRPDDTSEAENGLVPNNPSDEQVEIPGETDAQIAHILELLALDGDDEMGAADIARAVTERTGVTCSATKVVNVSRQKKQADAELAVEASTA